MPVHAIRVETAKTSSGTPVETVLNQYRAGRPEVLPDAAQEPRLIEPTDTEPLDVPYRRALFRFDESENPTDLLDDLEQRLQGKPAWYRIRYHYCSRDLDGGDPDKFSCSWDETATRTGGTVPPGLA